MDGMIVIPCKQSVFFDVDDTLVRWNPSQAEKDKYGIDFTCPGGLWMNPDGELVQSGSWTERLVPHHQHIEQLKAHKMRGHTVVVWSAGGWDWAEAVVRTLKLEQYVDLVISKPTWCYDDLQPNEFIPKPQFIKWSEV